jgi:hypothetical protein
MRSNGDINGFVGFIRAVSMFAALAGAILLSA